MKQILYASEEFFSKVFHASPLAMNAFRLADDCSIEVNTAFLSLTGYSRDEVINHTAAELNLFVDSNARNAWVKEVQEIGSSLPHVFHIRQKSGMIRDVSASFELVEIHGEKIVLVMAADITEHNQAKAEIIKGQNLLQSISDSSSALIYALDIDGRFTLINQKLELVLGVPREAMIGKTREAILPAEIAAEHRVNDLKVITSQESIIVDEENEEPDGKHFYLTTKFPLFDNLGRVIGIGGISTDITEQRRKEQEFEMMAAISAALRGAQSRAELLSIILEQLSILMNTKEAAFVMREFDSEEAIVELSIGEFALSMGSRLAKGQGITGQVIETCQPYLTNDASNETRFSQPGLLKYLKSVACVPLVANEKVLGALWVGKTESLNEHDLHLLTVVADIAANAIHRMTLYETTISDAIKLKKAYETTLEGWSRALDLRDKETEGHSLRVVELVMELARAAGVAEDEIANIRRGALLHDIGKIGIPDSILQKPDKLTEEEWLRMRQHPVVAYDMLYPIEHLRPSLSIPYSHHEKWDGTGYPQGLKGEEIPFSARLFAIVDVWDALTNDRPYRKAWSQDKAIEYIREQAGKHFDPKVVELFLQIQSRERQKAG